MPDASTTPKTYSPSFYDIDDDTLTSDVGSQPGTAWTLSSFKPGSGILELRSADMSKLWQSDGSQPHLVNIQFARRTLVSHVSIFLDVKSDDSYTPTKIAIKAGTNYHDLVLVRERTFDAPQGWKHFLLDKTDATPEEDEEEEDEHRRQAHTLSSPTRVREGIHVWMIQICVLANHLNGKDTHIRRIMVFGPNANDDIQLQHVQRAKRTAMDVPSSDPSRTKMKADKDDDGEEAQTRLYQNALPSHTTQADSHQTDAEAQRVTFGLADLLSRRRPQQSRSSAAHDAEETPAIRQTLSLFGNIR